MFEVLCVVMMREMGEFRVDEFLGMLFGLVYLDYVFDAAFLKASTDFIVKNLCRFDDVVLCNVFWVFV